MSWRPQREWPCTRICTVKRAKRGTPTTGTSGRGAGFIGRRWKRSGRRWWSGCGAEFCNSALHSRLVRTLGFPNLAAMKPRQGWGTRRDRMLSAHGWHWGTDSFDGGLKDGPLATERLWPATHSRDSHRRPGYHPDLRPDALGTRMALGH